MISFDHNISNFKIKGLNYACVIPNQIHEIFKKNKTNIEFLCMLILNKKCKFYDKGKSYASQNVNDFYHILEVPVNKFEKIDIPVYTLYVNGLNCFTFQIPKEME